MIVLAWIAVFVVCILVIIIGRISAYHEHLAILDESDRSYVVEGLKRELEAVKAEAKAVDRGHHQVIYLNDPKAPPAIMERSPRRRSAASDSFGDKLSRSLYPAKDKIDADRAARQLAIAEIDKRLASEAAQLIEQDRLAEESRLRQMQSVVTQKSAKNPEAEQADDGYGEHELSEIRDLEQRTVDKDHDAAATRDRDSVILATRAARLADRKARIAAANRMFSS